MKVLKFGGTSVGSARALESVRSIVSAVDGDAVVVVSALSGVTDALVRLSALAAEGDKSCFSELEAIKSRHLDLVSELFGPSGSALKGRLEGMLSSLESICAAVYSLRTLPSKTRCEILSFGERMSCEIVSTLLGGAPVKDSTAFIKTFVREGKCILATAVTENLVRESFEGHKGVCVVPGFIASDVSDGSVSNLGRGGSDYTASIIAAALGASSLEIWTDVDGFMSADPKIIKTSFVIDELSFAEAMELCNFGAKVVYAPALYPLYSKDLPVYIKNTFNPSSPGTLIKRSVEGSGRQISGIASIGDISLLTVSAPSMAGVVGVDGRIFGALSREGVSVFLVSQSSSETGISLGVSSSDAEKAVRTLDGEFATEIEHGVMRPVHLENGLATVAVVGEGLKYAKGIAAKLFATLSRNNIAVLACAQGSSDYNISMVVEQKFLRKTLNVIHDGFFLSEFRELNLFVCGVGTVGGSLLEQIASQREKLMQERNLKLNVVGVARSSRGVFTRDGVDPAAWKQKMDADGIELNPQRLKDEVIGMNIFNSVFVDCTASPDVASLYADFLEHGISVVTANKIAASSDYANYLSLKEISRRKGVRFLFETNVGAGLPVINTINALTGSGDKIERIDAVLSGTLNFICNKIAEGVPFSVAVSQACEQGYAEPDPRIDLSGKDVVRKIVILSREAGYAVSREDVDLSLFVPKELFDCSIEEFWQKLPSLDEEFAAMGRRLAAEDKRVRFVASMEGGKCSAGLKEIPRGHAFYVLEGSNNIIQLRTERYHLHPMLIQGYGAGAAVTAAGVFADIMSVASV